MKAVPWTVWVVFVVLAGTGWGLWIYDKLEEPKVANSDKLVPPPHLSPPNPAGPPNYHGKPPVMPGLISPSVWREYITTRQKVLQQNSKLGAEYQELQSEMRVEREKLNAAMIHSDPKAAPIIAKLEAFRQQSAAVQGAPHPTQVSPAPSASK